MNWDRKLCKKCNICIEICSQKGLEFKDGELKLTGNCIKCKLCEKYCPDVALKIEDD
ncbi:4Fe-4S binding protein [Candidatus Woesearchaeota archaeon]|nr:4Fe-4S binding protein [Candidatus Woesearchaeota archaeon]